MCPLSRRRWLAFNQLLADLWIAAGGMGDIGFAFFALKRMRNALEFEPTAPENQDDLKTEGPRDLLVETASIWVIRAGEKMYHSTQEWNDEHDGLALGRGGARWSGSNGYNPRRWSLWKQVFTEVANDLGRRHNVVAAANVCVSVYIHELNYRSRSFL